MISGARRAVLVAAALLASTVGVLGVVGVVGAGQAFACDMREEFYLNQDALLADPAELEQRYRDWSFDESASFEVVGAYVDETVFEQPAEGDLSRGSVSTTFEVWGVWPDQTGPTLIPVEDRSGEPPNNCGWGPTGRTMGTREYYVVTTQGVFELSLVDFDSRADADALLTSFFGAPEFAPRDTSLESELIAQLEADRGRNVGQFLAVGAAALGAAAAVLWVQRNANRVANAANPNSDIA